MLSSRHFVAAFFSFSLGGCLSGQTGSPDCVGATSCVCDTLYSGGALLRVRGEAASDGRLVATVDEVVGSVYGPTDIRAGDRVGGDLTTFKPCDAQDPLLTLEGAELFVLFLSGMEGRSPSCEGQTAEVCAEQRSAALLSGAYRFVIPWAEELDFGADHRLPSSDVAALSSAQTCWERFPVDPAPPCRDTNIVCSLGQASAPSTLGRGWVWAGAMAGLALVCRARRRRGSAQGSQASRVLPSD